MSVKARFAPSPSGLLHIGNARSAVLNWAYIKSIGGDLLLRIDDTDVVRSKKEFETKIKNDLQWLGIHWTKTFNQSDKLEIYNNKIEQLKKLKKIYPCFETEEELALKRKSNLLSSKPPIYDRSALKLSQKEIDENISKGKKPHWRFKLEDGKIEWNDLIKGKVTFDSKNLSDPILIRQDGSLLYHLPSVIDDIDEQITHILRGEDHITNTAYHIQLFKAFNIKVPKFGHHPFLTDEKGKGFAKRLGSLSIEKIRKDGFENITIINYLLSVGTSNNLTYEKDINKLVKSFDINNLASSSPKFSLEVLKLLNKQILKSYDYLDIRNKFEENKLYKVSEDFWMFVRNNIMFFKDSFKWLEIIKSDKKFVESNNEYLITAAKLLPQEPYNHKSWDIWIKSIKLETGKEGKELFMPIRIALTGMEKGPELKYLLPLLTKDIIQKKLGYIE